MIILVCKIQQSSFYYTFNLIYFLPSGLSVRRLGYHVLPAFLWTVSDGTRAENEEIKKEP